MLRVQVSELKTLYKNYQQTQSVMEVVAGLETMRNAYGNSAKQPQNVETPSVPTLSREDLRLICFDIVSSA